MSTNSRLDSSLNNLAVSNPSTREHLNLLIKIFESVFSKIESLSFDIDGQKKSIEELVLEGHRQNEPKEPEADRWERHEAFSEAEQRKILLVLEKLLSGEGSLELLESLKQQLLAGVSETVSEMEEHLTSSKDQIIDQLIKQVLQILKNSNESPLRSLLSDQAGDAVRAAVRIFSKSCDSRLKHPVNIFSYFPEFSKK